MDNVSLGELIRKKRKEKQMTQGELASLLYVSTNAISKWELAHKPQEHAVWRTAVLHNEQESSF